MHKITLIVFALFCSNIALSGEFTTIFQPKFSALEGQVQVFAGHPKEKQMVKDFFSGLLHAMNKWLDGKRILSETDTIRGGKAGQPYIMDDEDNALLQKVTILVQ